MITLWRRPAVVLAIAFVTLAWVSGAEKTPPKLISKVAPEHPPELMEAGVDGHARISFRIDENGTVSDATVTEADDPAFGEAALAAVRQWIFEPGTREGVPVAMKVSQDFKFTVPPEKRTEIFARNLETLAGRPVFLEVTGPVIPMKDLKQRPKPVVPPVPLYPPKLAGSGKTGLVTVKFVINTEGQAVNPDIVSHEGEPVFTTLALVQVLRARWEPVKQKGKLVNVEMVLPMRFQEQPPAGRPQPRTRPAGGGGDDGG